MTKPKGQQADIRLLPSNKLQINTGQIPGVPRNPRLIKDNRFQKLKKSISDFPEMLELREIVVFPFKKSFVCIGGNMRLLACKELEIELVPCKVLPDSFPVEKIREFAIKDNINFGQDDFEIIANEWTDFDLDGWGAELPDLGGIDLDEFFKEDDGPAKEKTYSIVLNYTSEEECEAVKSALAKYGETFEAALHKILKL